MGVPLWLSDIVNEKNGPEEKCEPQLYAIRGNDLDITLGKTVLTPMPARSG
jgi:hypothetical protein